MKKLAINARMHQNDNTLYVINNDMYSQQKDRKHS
jgi:hypothetical protein